MWSIAQAMSESSQRAAGLTGGRGAPAHPHTATAAVSEIAVTHETSGRSVFIGALKPAKAHDMRYYRYGTAQRKGLAPPAGGAAAFVLTGPRSAAAASAA